MYPDKELRNRVIAKSKPIWKTKAYRIAVGQNDKVCAFDLAHLASTQGVGFWLRYFLIKHNIRGVFHYAVEGSSPHVIELRDEFFLSRAFVNTVESILEKDRVRNTPKNYHL